MMIMNTNYKKICLSNSPFRGLVGEVAVAFAREVFYD